MEFFFLADIFFLAEGQKKILSQEKKLQTTYFLEHVSLLRQKQNILNLKEFTQPTETRLYL